MSNQYFTLHNQETSHFTPRHYNTRKVRQPNHDTTTSATDSYAVAPMIQVNSIYNTAKIEHEVSQATTQIILLATTSVTED